jgi:hypothetical protein
MDPVGNFVVVWRSQDPGPNVQAQRYDAGGTPLGAQFQVNTHTTNVQEFPVVATDPLGNFVVVWYDNEQDDVRGQRFADGRPILGKKLLVKDPTGSARSLAAPRAAAR